jgi:hypothetical protein
VNGHTFLTSMTDVVRRSTGQDPKIVSDSASVDPGAYEIWLSSHKEARSNSVEPHCKYLLPVPRYLSTFKERTLSEFAHDRRCRIARGYFVASGERW